MVDASEAERLGRSSSASLTFAPRSREAERVNESCFIVRAAGVYLFTRGFHVTNATLFSDPDKVLKKYVVNISKYEKFGGEKYMRMIHNDKHTYRCTKCNYPYQSFKKYLHHFVLHKYNKMACPQCLVEFANIEQLSCHVNAHIKNNYVCVHSIHNEITSANSIRKFQCTICQEILVVSEFFAHWEKHLMVHGNEQERVSAVDLNGKPFLKEMIGELFFFYFTVLE